MKCVTVRFGALFCLSLGLAAISIACGDDDSGGSEGSGGIDLSDLAPDNVYTGSGGGINTSGSSGGSTATGVGGSTNAATCPSEEPNDGAACDPAEYPDPCVYGDVTCECTRGGWACETAPQAAECPTGEPQDGSDCPQPGLSCDYGDVQCQCTNGGWDCVTVTAGECPATEPNDGDSCDTDNLSCDYGNTQCRCGGRNDNLTWRCD